MADVVCVCVHWLLRCKCRIVKWKYVSLGVGNLKFDTADVCVW